VYTKGNMPKLPKELLQWLQKLGIDQKSLMRIRFGGVIGKQALVGVVGVGGLVVVAARADGLLLWGSLIGIFVLTILVVLAIGIHGHRHPLEATLEGGEVVVLQHLRQELAAKGAGQLPSLPPVLEGLGERPALEDKGESQT
jgi:hypothetical protein